MISRTHPSSNSLSVLLSYLLSLLCSLLDSYPSFLSSSLFLPLPPCLLPHSYSFLSSLRTFLISPRIISSHFPPFYPPFFPLTLFPSYYLSFVLSFFYFSSRICLLDLPRNLTIATMRGELVDGLSHMIPLGKIFIGNPHSQKGKARIKVISYQRYFYLFITFFLL